jgi:manganese/zinc/iron transport system permease protein
VFAEIEFLKIWSNPTLQLVSLGTGTLGVVAGALGCFALLRKQSLLGDAVSHAALPGVMLSFILLRSKAPLPLVLGAAMTGWLAALLAPRITRSTRLPIDTALCGIMSVFFGIGYLLQSYIQHRNEEDASQAGLDRFIFGQAATLLVRDVWLIAGLGGAALIVMLVFWKELKLLSFDSEFAASLGRPVLCLNVLLTSLLVVAIVIGLQSVGVVLMSALVVAPGAAARQWTDRLGRMVALAAVFGGVSGVAGTVISDQWRHVPTGPTIVLCATAIVLASLLLAPRRGLVWNLAILQRSETRASNL